MSNEETTDISWEYTIVHTDRLTTPSGPQLAPIWRRKYADGSTDWDQINGLGADGWEMVNAFPVDSGGSLQYLAFVFKRPRREGSVPQGDKRMLGEPAIDEAQADQSAQRPPAGAEAG